MLSLCSFVGQGRTTKYLSAPIRKRSSFLGSDLLLVSGQIEATGHHVLPNGTVIEYKEKSSNCKHIQTLWHQRENKEKMRAGKLTQHPFLVLRSVYNFP